MHCRYFDTTRKGNHSSFLTATVVGGRGPLPSEICAQSDSAPFEKRQLWQISACNVSTKRDSKKCLFAMNSKPITGFSMSYRLKAYITPKCPKGGSKSDFFLFLDKTQLQSNKVCYKVFFLCETSKSTVVVQPYPYLTVRRSWHEITLQPKI